MQTKCYGQNYRTDVCSPKCKFKAECDTYYKKHRYIPWVEKTKKIKEELKNYKGSK